MLTSKDGQVIQESTIMSSYRETTGLLVSDVERAAGVGPRYVRVGCIGDGELSKDESEEGEPEASRREIHEGRGTRCPEGLGLEAKTGPGCQRELMSKREMDIFGKVISEFVMLESLDGEREDFVRQCVEGAWYLLWWAGRSLRLRRYGGKQARREP